MRFISVLRIGIVAALIVSGTTAIAAKKYKAINEFPDQIPENEEEQGIWEIGKAHQEEVRSNGEAIDNPDLERYLESVVSRLMGDMVEHIGMEVDVLVFKDPTVNAWVYPNGTIAVQTGLLAAMENEAELAAILGHEISHFLNRHAYIQIKSKQKQSVIGKGLGLLATAAVAAKTGSLNTGLMKYGQVWTELVTSGYSRNLETKADEQGLQLLVDAGYPPLAAPPAFDKLRIKEDDEVNVAKMWSSHPDIDSRIKNLNKRIKRLKTPAPTEEFATDNYIRQVGDALLVNSQLYLERRQFDSAIADLDRYLEVHDDKPTGFFLLGEAYRKQQREGNFEARVGAYSNAITVDPSYAVAYKERGMVYRQMGNASQAIEELNRYLEHSPEALDTPIIRWYVLDLQTNGARKNLEQK